MSEKESSKERKSTRNPTGSIFKRRITKRGRKIDVWDVRKRYYDEAERKYKDKTRRCYSRSEALAALASMPLEIEQEKQKAAAPAEATFFQLAEYFRAEYVKPAVYSGSRKIAGYRQNLKTLNRFIDEFKTHFGDVPLRSIRYDHIRTYTEREAKRLTKKETVVAPSTYHQKLTVLGRMFNIAIQMEWLEVSPMKRGKNLIQRSAEKPRNRMLTFEEEERLLAACEPEAVIKYVRSGKEIEATIPTKREHLKIYILLSLDTGMRRGEVYNLRWHQVDFERRVIYLTEEAAKETKTGVEGILPLTSRLADVLLEHRENSPKTSLNDFVVGKKEIKRAFASACRAAGIENFQYRDLRAAAIVRMMQSGVSGDYVRKISRHTSDKIFLAHYTRINEDGARFVGDKLEEFNEKERRRVKDQGDAK